MRKKKSLFKKNICFFSKGDMFAIKKQSITVYFLNQTLFFSSGKCILLASLNKKKPTGFKLKCVILV